MSWAEVKKDIAKTFAYYGRSVDDVILKMYVDDLQEISSDPSEVRAAYKRWRSESKYSRPPIPADIRRLLRPQSDPEKIAQDGASRVIGAVSKYGYTNGRGAREYLGEDLWEIVDRFGGWNYLCSNLGTNLKVSSLFAQMRDTLNAQGENVLGKISGHLGGESCPVVENKKQEVLQIVRDTIKEI